MTTTDSRRADRQAPRWVDVAIAVCVVGFIAARGMFWGVNSLLLIWSLPGLATSVLCARRMRAGYVLGIVSGVLGGLTGAAVPMLTAIAHPLTSGAAAGLVLFSLIGYIRLPNKSPADIGLFIVAAVLVFPLFIVESFAELIPAVIILASGSLLGTLFVKIFRVRKDEHPSLRN